MWEAVCEYATRASDKLRRENQCAKAVTIFLRTSPFTTHEPQYANSITGELPIPSNDTRDLIEISRSLLTRIWRDGFRYAKAGIMLNDFYDPGVYQPGLFDTHQMKPGSTALMATLDAINHTGKGKIWFAGQGIRKDWDMKRGHLSPAYTTRWSDIPTVQ